MTSTLSITKFTRKDGEIIPFVYKKLHPIVDPETDPSSERWRPTARRVDVLLPPGVPDDFQDVAELVRSFDRQTVPDQDDLAIHLKAVIYDGSYHEYWERVRSFVMDHLVLSAGLPSIMVLHSPVDRGFTNAAEPHIHVLTLSRQRLPGRWDRTTPLVFGGLADLASAWSP